MSVELKTFLLNIHVSIFIINVLFMINFSLDILKPNIVAFGTFSAEGEDLRLEHLLFYSHVVW